MPSTAAALTLPIPTAPSSITLSNTKDSDPALSPPIDLLYTKEDKDTLAYEHDRGQYMKTLDRARMKARKAFAWGNGSLTASHSHGGQKGGGSHGRGRNLGLPLEEGRKEDRQELRELAGEYTPTGVVRGTDNKQNQDFAFSAGKPFTEVRLADLVVFAASAPNLHHSSMSRGRKGGIGSAGKGGLDGDFEIIPHVKSVIVLEDGVGSGELEEAWECVQAEDEATRSGKTYARVAAAGLEIGD